VNDLERITTAGECYLRGNWAPCYFINSAQNSTCWYKLSVWYLRANTTWL